MKSLIVLLVFFMSVEAFAKRQGPSDEQIEQMARHNAQAAQVDRRLGVRSSFSNIRPFAEYEKTGYVVFSDDDYSGIAREIKRQVASHLPDDVMLIIYTQSNNKSYHQQLFNTYASYISPERLRVVQVPVSGTNDFWTRDNTPLPVLGTTEMGLVDARYYYNFEPDDFFGRLFGSVVDKHHYFFEGGNFIANRLGDCIVVNRRASYPGGISDTAAIPDDVFRVKYGCKNLIRLRHLKGIGHSDEVVKFMDDNTVITDTPEYVSILRSAGFRVIEMPEGDLRFESYINSLQVNDTIFVPVFGERNDQLAINLYKSLNSNYKIVPVQSRRLATQGQGGVHCITQNYPPGPIHVIKRLLESVLD